MPGEAWMAPFVRAKCVWRSMRSSCLLETKERLSRLASAEMTAGRAGRTWCGMRGRDGSVPRRRFLGMCWAAAGPCATPILLPPNGPEAAESKQNRARAWIFPERPPSLAQTWKLGTESRYDARPVATPNSSSPAVSRPSSKKNSVHDIRRRHHRHQRLGPPRLLKLRGWERRHDIGLRASRLSEQSGLSASASAGVCPACH